MLWPLTVLSSTMTQICALPTWKLLGVRFKVNVLACGTPLGGRPYRILALLVEPLKTILVSPINAWLAETALTMRLERAVSTSDTRNWKFVGVFSGVVGEVSRPSTGGKLVAGTVTVILV